MNPPNFREHSYNSTTKKVADFLSASFAKHSMSTG
jgi:hypothetical protein